jgi:hypothetical protein
MLMIPYFSIQKNDSNQEFDLGCCVSAMIFDGIPTKVTVEVDEWLPMIQ